MTSEALLLEDAADAVVQVEVGGRPLTDRPAPPCAHSSFGTSVVVAEVRAADGSLSHREARLRLRCMECGAPCEIETSGRSPADGEPGVVVKFSPLQLPSPQSQGEPHAG